MTRKGDATIVTLNGYTNYGNRLQIFALSKVLKEFNIYPLVYWHRSLKSKIKAIVKYKTPLLFINRKERELLRFSKKHTPPINNGLKTKNIIIGSDQVWNPEYLKTNPTTLFIKAPNSNCVAYAASMGTERLTAAQQQMFRKALKNYSRISVREEQAKKILAPLTDKKIEVVLDPTLLIDKKTYEKMEKKPKNIKEDTKYILCYILGNPDYEKVIRQYAKNNKLDVIYFSDRKDSGYSVEEFLYLIHHASLICTDSFHACVFSFIFDRPFIAFRRTGKYDYMYSRISNLVNLFKLSNREYNGKKITIANIEYDYTEGHKILKLEQQKSINYLKDALGIKQHEH